MDATKRILEIISRSGERDYTLEKKLGISVGCIAAWRRGRANPGFDALLKIADYFQISLDELVGRTTPAPAAAVPDGAEDITALWSQLDEFQQAKLLGYAEALVKTNLTPAAARNTQKN